MFLRSLLAVKVIGQVVHDLVGFKQNLPEEHMIECVCELLQAIGYTLETTDHGRLLMKQFYLRLKELKSSNTTDGKKSYSRRIECLIQDLLELRDNDWKKKVYREQAQTKEAVRANAAREQRQQAKGAETTFSTQVFGAKPAYIINDDSKNKGRGKADQSQRLDSTYVKKLMHYFNEDKGEKGGDTKAAENLDRDWQKASPSRAENKQALDLLIEVGMNDPTKEDVVAEMIAELVTRQAPLWEVIREALDQPLKGLEDTKMDTPKADIFIHSLYAKLWHRGSRDLIATTVRPLQLVVCGDSVDFGWSLMVGAFKKLRSSPGGSDAARKALGYSEVLSLCTENRRCAAQEVERLLKKDGAL